SGDGVWSNPQDPSTVFRGYGGRMSGKARSAPTERPDDASAHLQPRKQAGFVTTRRAGVRVHHRIADDVAPLLTPPRRVAEAHQTAPSVALAACLGEARAAELSRAGPRSRIAAGGAVVLGMRP